MTHCSSGSARSTSRRRTPRQQAATRRTIGTALLTTCVLYLALGTLCALFFQGETRKVIAPDGTPVEYVVPYGALAGAMIQVAY